MKLITPNGLHLLISDLQISPSNMIVLSNHHDNEVHVLLIKNYCVYNKVPKPIESNPPLLGP